ncbi:hypothetical protein Lalb_Chr11g0075881 [Lupinus albus]|uniref:Uncharacterized protein n=1 Tax=Lupinus albus TaxID=3870 RepID=A0A6A4PTR5_LUPAL|nr:hypothetical protein Lalb_Chr11g0075881 [Lupinus albus]
MHLLIFSSVSLSSYHLSLFSSSLSSTLHTNTTHKPIFCPLISPVETHGKNRSFTPPPHATPKGLQSWSPVLLDSLGHTVRLPSKNVEMVLLDLITLIAIMIPP